MLKILRKRKVAKRIFYVLAIIIVPAFVFWGSASVIRDKQTKGYAGMVFGKRVSYEEYRSTLHAWRNQLRMKFGDKAYQIESLFDPNQAAWDKIILRYEAEKRKIKVGNKELTEYITSLPFLQKDGIFDSELYELFLRYSLNTPPRIFEEEMRENLKFQKLFDQVTKDIQITEKEIKDKYKQEHEQIKVKYVSILSKDIEKEVNLNEQDLKAYYEKQKEEFKIPIQINLNFMGMEYTKGANEEQKKEVDEKVNEIRKFLDEGNDLIKASEKFGLPIQETGFFSIGEPVPGLDWLPENFAQLFNLNEKQISDVMQNPGGTYIFQLKEKRIDYLPAFEEVKDKIKDKVTKEKAKELARTKIDEYYSQIKAKKESDSNLDLTKIAKQLSLPLKETDFFSINSGAKDIGFSKEFNDAVFNLTDGQISEVIELPQGYFVIEVSERKPIDEQQFEKERENLKQTLLKEKKDQAFEEFFVKLKDRANLIDYIAIQQNQKSPSKSN